MTAVVTPRPEKPEDMMIIMLLYVGDVLPSAAAVAHHIPLGEILILLQK